MIFIKFLIIILILIVIFLVFKNNNEYFQTCSDIKVPDPSNPSELIDWYDSYGATYNCGYYEEYDYCKDWGDGYTNFGMTANDACCACGGGNTPSTTKYTNFLFNINIERQGFNEGI